MEKKIIMMNGKLSTSLEGYTQIFCPHCSYGYWIAQNFAAQFSMKKTCYNCEPTNERSGFMVDVK